MELRTYRAATMHEALALVRRELGPDAAVLHTREVAQPLAGPAAGPAANRGHRLARRERAEPLAAHAVAAGEAGRRSRRRRRKQPARAAADETRALASGAEPTQHACRRW